MPGEMEAMMQNDSRPPDSAACPHELDLHAHEVAGLAAALSLLLDGDGGEPAEQAALRQRAIAALADVLPRHAAALHTRLFNLEVDESAQATAPADRAAGVRA